MVPGLPKGLHFPTLAETDTGEDDPEAQAQPILHLGLPQESRVKRVALS